MMGTAGHNRLLVQGLMLLYGLLLFGIILYIGSLDTSPASHGFSKPYIEKIQQIKVEIIDFPFSNTNNSLLGRLGQFNEQLTIVRNEVLKRRGPNKTWEKPVGSQAEILVAEHDNFVDNMIQYDNINSVGIKWLKTDRNKYGGDPNLLLGDYYNWASVSKLCQLIKNGKTKAPYHILYNYTCSEDKNILQTPEKLLPLDINRRGIVRNRYWPVDKNGKLSDSYNKYPEYALYMHVLEDCFVTSVGDVYTKNLKIVPDSCSRSYNLQHPNKMLESPFYEEVLVISQYWGNGFFHKMVEVMPRLAPYRKFLSEHPDVKVMVPHRKNPLLTGVFGLEESRLVTGPVRAGVLYLPRGTPCGNARAQETQLLSHIYREHINTTLHPGARNKVVLIQRSGSRRLSNHQEVVQAVRGLAATFGLEFAHWTDRPVLSMEAGMRMFSEAVMVVAPHGAGEANLLFTHPGTYIIELICNPPHVNLCYQRLARVLGLRYYALMSQQGCEGYIHVPLKEISATVEFFLNMWKRAG